MIAVLVNIKALHPKFELPKLATHGSCAWDLCYWGDRPLTIHCGQVYKLPLGFSMELPQDWELLLLPRSGLAADHGITLLNSPGLVDADYRGPISALIVKLASVNVPVETIIEPGQRICQGSIRRSYAKEIEFRLVDSLTETTRGAGGFGSTGR